jgi:xanthine dehydrogenase YagR molybdenum-binding subunit
MSATPILTAPKPVRQLDYRYEGISKVTGRAKYAAEFSGPFAKSDLLYAHMVLSTIPNGTIDVIDTTAASRAPGVVVILTPFNAPKLDMGPRHNITLLQDKQVHYNGQPIAVVVAKTLDQARAAANLLGVSYTPRPAKLNYAEHLDDARWPKNPGHEPSGNHRGDVSAGFAQSAIIVEETYTTPIQTHNPMEPHATIAWWEGDKLNYYDATQYIVGDRASMARVFSLPPENLHLMDPLVGGGFGSKGTMWSHAPLCALAAKVTGKPVKLAIDRNQMFTTVGSRPATHNRIKLGASADGKLLAMQHDVVIPTSISDDFAEHAEGVTKTLYASAANSVSNKMVEVNLGMFTYMRAPGEAPGTATLEIALDELAEKLKMDPMELRLINYAEADPSNGRPWTSKHLKEAYLDAAKRFGWSKRNPIPGQVVEGNELIGYGMATATYPANQSPCGATVRLLPNGHVYVGSATHDLGTGMYTIMAQQAAAPFGIDPRHVEVHLGDSSLPKAPVSGGSQSSASVMPAIMDGCQKVIDQAIALATNDPASPLHGLPAAEIIAEHGALVHSTNPAHSESLAALLTRNGGKPLEAEGANQPSADARAKWTSNSWGAIFAEVTVDKSTGMVKVRRIVGTYDIGTLLNEKTGMNQMMGGFTMSVGFALEEETIIDPVYGRPVNGNLGDYHVPVNPDIGTMEIRALGIPDMNFSPAGARGIGEISNTGTHAAIANAVYNATGKRIRSYPITPDKILMA